MPQVRSHSLVAAGTYTAPRQLIVPPATRLNARRRCIGVIDRLVLAGVGADADDLRDYPRDLGRRVELPFAFPDSVAKWRMRYS
jgi:hypothetical protein